MKNNEGLPFQGGLRDGQVASSELQMGCVRVVDCDPGKS